MIWLAACLLVQDSGIAWERDHAASLQKAREFRKPVLIYFRAAT